ncbi:MAG: fatty acid--CoA ligase family protein [Rhodospirillales bacterium]|nr:fatty acid--CoA ligase family protein [Rhodospirillales bacterium]
MAYIYTAFRDMAKRFPQKNALVAQGQIHSYGALSRQADLWAAFLYARIEQKQPRVAILVEDPFHSITISLGVARLDGVCIPTNSQLPSEQQLENWETTDVCVVIYEPILEHKIKALMCGDLIFISTRELEHFESDTVTSEIPASFPWTDQAGFLIAFSSGSTGTPKPTVLSQETKCKRAKQTWDLYNLSSDDVVLCASPYFHSLGQRLVYVALLLGATLVYVTKFAPKLWLGLVHEYKVSFAISVSSHLYALKDALLQNAEQLRSLKTIVTSSAPIDAGFKNQLFEAIGCDFNEIYGATEIAIATNLTKDDATQKYMTVGTPCSNVQVRILDDARRIIPINTIGEIAVKSPVVFDGYYKQPEATRQAFIDGFFLTGDLGYFDGDGFLTYVSRKKDVIISGGINIYPKEIEAVIAQDDEVREVAVIGVEDKMFGEVAIAICITEGNKNIAPQLHRLANIHLAPHQRPLKYFFLESLPLTSTGKVSKLALREHFNGLNQDWTLPLRKIIYGE